MENINPRKSPWDIIGTWGDELKGKKIVLCVTGSISAYRTPDLARTLIRYGAKVIPCLSSGAQKIIHPYALEWATGIKPLTEMTAEMEHLTPFYEDIDLLAIIPATANIIGKIANGVADEIVSSTTITAMGMGKPILIVPTMHKVMFDSPILQENIEKLRKHGVHILEPIVMEEKAKIPEIHDIVDYIIHLLYEKDLKGKSVLVTAGPTLEYIDPIRVITNKSSGKMGVEIARNAWYRGAKVYLVYGKGKVKPPVFLDKIVKVETTEEMYDEVKKLLQSEKIDIVVATAAAADLKPAEKHERKIKTEDIKDRFKIELELTPKIINMVKEVSPNTILVSFKAEYGLPENELVEKAYNKLVSSRSDLIVVNDVSKRGIGFESDENEVIIIDRDKNILRVPKTTKRRLAGIILDKVKTFLEGEN